MKVKILFGTLALLSMAGTSVAQNPPTQKAKAPQAKQEQQIVCDQRGCREAPPGCKVAPRNQGPSRTSVGDTLICN
jgi:hypothetical protein